MSTISVEKEHKDNAEEVYDVTGINDPFADGGIMVFDTQCFDVVAESAERLERVDESKAEIADEAEECRDDESNDLIVRDGRGEDADGNESGTQKDQSEIGSPGAAHVDIADGVAEHIDGDDVYEGGNQGDN